ncbi:hypothetical protein P171DRAFT_438408 [Karstenula rhodostoma CBS 690.94]|uniref:Uncharacterized protein n=1 Tax=Karstenula rhodostoma CBS 690.94 TaxID=1392251 RepID=A0A9P4PYN5_9PLEO|nr:hypothetical protein P171DRAFT_438408 [Karstenula rhodostoma CBS 690.94]
MAIHPSMGAQLAQTILLIRLSAGMSLTPPLLLLLTQMVLQYRMPCCPHRIKFRSSGQYLFTVLLSTVLMAVTPSPTLSPGTTQLSAPSRLGIGLGVGVGGALVLAVIGYMFLRRRIRKRNSLRGNTYTDKPELDGQVNSNVTNAHEVQDDQIHEIMSGTVEPVEIDRSRQIHEIEDTGAPVEAHTTSNVPEMEAAHGRTEIGTASTSDDQNHS